MNFFLGLFLTVLSFGSPVHIPVELAGNFGEPRPNHFHGGIDVKTNRGVNLGIYSIADGYVSRAIIQKYGFGYALVIAHPNGYSSVYVHLNRFAPQIEASVKQWQYKNRQFAADITFNPGQIPVRKGQFIALSGNTGSSQAPHLHMELHQTKTGLLMDPLNVVGHVLKDKTAPTIYSFKSYPQRGEGIFQHSQESRVYGFSRQVFKAWGKVGFGIFAHDNMDSVYNNYGVRYTELYCDGHLIFSSDVNGIPANAHPMINTWGDYEHYLHSRIWFLKSFTEPFNKLPILKSDKSRGIVTFNQIRDYHLKYIVKDYFGNKSEREFVVRGEPEMIVRQPVQKSSYALIVGHKNKIMFDGVKLEVGDSSLSKNYLLQPKTLNIPNAVSLGYCFSPTPLALLGSATIYIKVRNNVKDPSKLFIASRQDLKNGQSIVRYCGGELKDGWLMGKIRDLNKIYYAYYDNTPPLILSKSLHPHNIAFILSDDGSNIYKYEGYIDGKFVLFTYGKNKDLISCNLSETPIKPTETQRLLRIIVTDNRGNSNKFESRIIY